MKDNADIALTKKKTRCFSLFLDVVEEDKKMRTENDDDDDDDDEKGRRRPKTPTLYEGGEGFSVSDRAISRRVRYAWRGVCGESERLLDAERRRGERRRHTVEPGTIETSGNGDDESARRVVRLCEFAFGILRR